MRASVPPDFHFLLPLGTWSDDTSLLLCVLDALSIKYKYDKQELPPMTKEQTDSYKDNIDKKIYKQFKSDAIKWMNAGKFTNHGFKIPFDIGNSCRKGILAMMTGVRNKTADDEYSNGNGGLMRIPPLAFFDFEDDEELLKYIKLFNECSHNHKVSHIGCLIYIKLAKNLIKENISIKEALIKTVNSIDNEYKIKEYERIWNLSILDVGMDEIRSSGYVVDTLEAVIWSCANNSTYKDTVLTAVNLLEDTDTVAALSGFISAIHHNDIPCEWVKKIRKKEIITKICKKFS